MKMGKFLAALAGLALTFGAAGQALAADAIIDFFRGFLLIFYEVSPCSDSECQS